MFFQFMLNNSKIENYLQIVSCLCEFVEANRSDIRSGWRPLFGALKVVNSSHLSTLLEVFRVFLNTDDTLAFSNAAVDCIACLIKHVKGTSKYFIYILNCMHIMKYKLHKFVFIILDIDNSDNDTRLELCKAALKHLQHCSLILRSMYVMPACPKFHLPNR